MCGFSRREIPAHHSFPWRDACAARDLPDRELRQDDLAGVLRYELGKPRYTPDECRQLRLTYGRPFRVWLRLNKEQPIEEEVYLGDMPIMLGGGEFIINGAERVVVSQLHRSPGVDFVIEHRRHQRPQAAQLPDHSRARQLDRDQRHQEGQRSASASTRAASSRR
jgi:DNA-directed RNA polymerase beta subunit